MSDDEVEALVLGGDVFHRRHSELQAPHDPGASHTRGGRLEHRPRQVGPQDTPPDFGEWQGVPCGAAADVKQAWVSGTSELRWPRSA